MNKPPFPPVSFDQGIRKQLEQVREWANAKIVAGQEPPWAWFQYMKLREVLDGILAGMDSVTTEHLQQSAAHSETHLRLVANTDPQDNAPYRPVGLPVQLPT